MELDAIGHELRWVVAGCGLVLSAAVAGPDGGWGSITSKITLNSYLYER